MGVKDLWSIISAVGERKSLWELKDKTVAIDLSCWVVSDNLCARDHALQPRMYLRNLFFRTTCLLLLGVRPVFVLEGMAPELKHAAMAKRKNANWSQKTHSKPSGRRSRLTSSLKQCQKLLNIMGLSCVQSPGEAEAYCALLDQHKLVDGCITQDGDAFLYGAETVYRNFTISPSGNSSGSNAGFSVDVFKMCVIEEKLSLKRNDLIAISLLCGCDYNEKGIEGVGKESVMKFLSGVRGEDVLNRLKRWRSDSYFDKLDKQKSDVFKGILCEICGHTGRKQKHQKSGCADCAELKGCLQNPSMMILSDPAMVAELNIRRKALLNPEFPSEAMLTEFLQQNSDTGVFDCTWRRPDLPAFIKFSTQLLGWTEAYALEKFLPIVTRWQIQNCMNSLSTCVFVPKTITKRRVLKGIESYQVQWSDPLNILSGIEYDEEDLVTVEPRFLMEKTYPSQVESFTNAAKKPPKKGSKAKKKVGLGKENSIAMAGVQTRLDHFFKETKTTSLQNIESIFKKSITQVACKSTNEIDVLNAEKSEHIHSCDSLSRNFSALKISDGDTASIRSDNFCVENEKNCSKPCKYSQNTKLTNVCNCDVSICWESCTLCQDDDSQEDFNLSEIIDCIVSKHDDKVVSTSCDKNKNERTMEASKIPQNTDLDEFDLLAFEDNHVPLALRIKTQLVVP